jgi:hypothetical protein
MQPTTNRRDEPLMPVRRPQRARGARQRDADHGHARRDQRGDAVETLVAEVLRHTHQSQCSGDEQPERREEADEGGRSRLLGCSEHRHRGHDNGADEGGQCVAEEVSADDLTGVRDIQDEQDPAQRSQSGTPMHDHTDPEGRDADPRCERPEGMAGDIGEAGGRHAHQLRGDDLGEGIGLAGTRVAEEAATLATELWRTSAPGVTRMIFPRT